MAILNKYKHWFFKLKPLKNNYWDFVISKDNTPSNFNAEFKERNCLSSYINFSDKNCYNDNIVHSYPFYSWEKAINNGVIFNNIGLTGIDNGFIYYGGWEQISNKEFLNILTNSEFSISSGDTSLYLYPVTGNTGLYSYDYTIENDYLALNGGFYQGIFKAHNFDYQILPNYIENEWNIEITLMPKDYKEKTNTLNS